MDLSAKLQQELDRWRMHPRRNDFLYLLGVPFRRLARSRHLEAERRRLLFPPIDTTNMEVLGDELFRQSAQEVKAHTLLDVGRLANLWTFARLVGPGAFLEVGTYRGGGALHILNAISANPQPFYSFDPFEDGGFDRNIA